jgi:PTS system glucitol/sorbitol-specific IIA component
MTAADSNPAATTVVYESVVTAVGGQVEAFLDHGLLIFFGDQAPAELHDISVLHSAGVAEDGPHPGDVIDLGDVSLDVLAVGPVVRDNLLNLGHLDLKADGRTDAKLPGDVCVRVGDIPLLKAGDAFRIRRPHPSAPQPSDKDNS